MPHAAAGILSRIGEFPARLQEPSVVNVLAIDNTTIQFYSNVAMVVGAIIVVMALVGMWVKKRKK